ncbi:hypothetical protein BDD12DRAFT_896943 [Trichophaea hybrida]|nr:hypothetical protein BDD12DRAFT_896943 [Trichophaea hybrida]
MVSTHPEFIPFTTPNLCKEYGISYDSLNFVEFTSRQRLLLKPLYPCEPACMEVPGTTHGRVRAQTFSRADGRFCSIQRWRASHTLGFSSARLSEVSAACEFSLDIETDFLVDRGSSVSTAALNGLASKWFDALGRQDPRRLKKRLERILSALRQLMLLRSALQDPYIAVRRGNSTKPRDYRVLLSIDTLGRVVGLLLGYHPPQITNGLSAPSPVGMLEDKRFLHGIHIMLQEPVEEVKRETLEKKGWCRCLIRRLGELDTSYLVCLRIIWNVR